MSTTNETRVEPEVLWAIVTGPNPRTGKRYILLDTIARTKRGSIARYNGQYGDLWTRARKKRGYSVIRVRVEAFSWAAPSTTET